jgi:hypothetical protein
MDMQPLAELAMSLQNANNAVMKNAASLQRKSVNAPKFVVPGLMDGSRFYEPKMPMHPYGMPQGPPQGYAPMQPQMRPPGY